MRFSVACCVLSLCLAAGARPAAAEPVAIETRAVLLDDRDAARHTVGALRYRGGLMLRSSDPRFGGFSALGVSSDGKRMIALSDRGLRLGAHLVYDAKGDLAGVRDGDLGALSGPDGLPLADKTVGDAESLTPGAEGEIIVAFERHHRLWRYFPGDPLPRPLPPPAELAGAPANGGIEALTMLSDGRLLAISEKYGARAGGDVIGWVSSRDGWSVLTFAVEDEFWPTGAATLPDGDVIVLTRRFTLRAGAQVRLLRVPEAAVAPAARLVGRRLAEISFPLTVDNFEGIDARRGPRGETLLYVISDDNFNPLQRTLLMMFEMAR